MPTASDRAREEADRWAGLEARWYGVSTTEHEIVTLHDPSHDLDRRAREWGHEFQSHDLGGLAGFARALAETEAGAWETEILDLATRAFEMRRFLIADRIIHWAVPWLLTVDGAADAGFLLNLGDEMRLAPTLPGREGLTLEGEDAFGPLNVSIPGTIWSGWVGEANRPSDVAEYWTRIAAERPGTAQLWLDLAKRADSDH